MVGPPHCVHLLLSPLSPLFEARVDIAGGWTDTPPQAYEQGGAVVTLAIKINNEVIVTWDLE